MVGWNSESNKSIPRFIREVITADDFRILPAFIASMI
jgi:hypothetical protein